MKSVSSAFLFISLRLRYLEDTYENLLFLVLRWASQRKVFGKPLIGQAVVRAKIAGMISRAEAIQAWLENITYQMCNMSYKEQATKLAGYAPLSFSIISRVLFLFTDSVNLIYIFLF